VCVCVCTRKQTPRRQRINVDTSAVPCASVCLSTIMPTKHPNVIAVVSKAQLCNYGTLDAAIASAPKISCRMTTKTGRPYVTYGTLLCSDREFANAHVPSGQPTCAQCEELSAGTDATVRHDDAVCATCRFCYRLLPHSGLNGKQFVFKTPEKQPDETVFESTVTHEALLQDRLHLLHPKNVCSVVGNWSTHIYYIRKSKKSLTWLPVKISPFIEKSAVRERTDLLRRSVTLLNGKASSLIAMDACEPVARSKRARRDEPCAETHSDDSTTEGALPTNHANHGHGGNTSANLTLESPYEIVVESINKSLQQLAILHNTAYSCFRIDWTDHDWRLRENFIVSNCNNGGATLAPDGHARIVFFDFGNSIVSE